MNKSKVLGLCLTAISIDKDHKDRPRETNATLSFSYLGLDESGNLIPLARALPFNIKGCVEYYKKTNKLVLCFMALVENYCDLNDIEAEGVYTSKNFNQDVQNLQRRIKKGEFNYESK